ncbi:MurT ligase domain-containing protein [uncultured Amnibacterium sp.]|uniref:Mur ligase family protein n=2 Tax=Actinomycetes TaxID=1760 RepID=UPI0035CBF247
MPAPSAPPPLAGRVRLRGAIWAGRLAAVASRVAGRGSGASIRGQVMMRLDPEALAKLLRGRRVAMVSGTNGKTTTTHFLAGAVRASLGDQSRRLVHNADGANLHHGIASALSGQPDADIAVLETDERVVADLVRLGRPEVLVLLNFSRDQLDRHHEIKGLGRSWRTALAAAGEDGPVVVANADEPLIVWAAETARRVVWVDTASTWTQDASLCPNCGSGLVREQPGSTGEGGGHWHCSGCRLAQPAADYRVADGRILDRAGQAWDPQLRVPGAFNVGNAACALAAAELLGVDTATALEGMRTVTAPAGRFATMQVGGTTARLLLAKNPAGWAEALPLAQTDTVVLAIDSAAADGRDVSWLWDVEYEQLAGRTVVATGPRAQDLAVRLAYAEVECRCVPDLAQALAGHPAPVDVIATYTPFQRLRKLGGV